MPHYELVRPASSSEPAPPLLAVSGQMLVAAAVTHCGYDSGKDSDKDPGKDSDHSERRSWFRRPLVTRFRPRTRKALGSGQVGPGAKRRERGE